MEIWDNFKKLSFSN